MANVLMVRDTRNDALCAMKLLHRIGGNDAVHNRFRREFRALSRLFHPNVLKVDEWGIHGDRPWFTMELIEGEDLRSAMVRWQGLAPEARFRKVHDVLVQTTRALAYVHGRGLVHRDVSPGNILLQHDGTVKLADFGLVTDRSTELTTAGEIMGTLAIVSPEHLRGERVDGRSDLYALGMVLYEMLTGRKPFNAHTPQGWVNAHLHERVRPPSDAFPLVPPLLDDVCVRLLKKEPAARYASAEHLLQVLGDTTRVQDVHDWPPRLVGRTDTQAWIQAAIEDVAARRGGGALRLQGESGSGKTRLLDLAERTAQRLGVRVARARCQPLGRPFGPFITIFETLRTPLAPDLLVRALTGGTGVPTERYPIIAAFRDFLVDIAPCVLLIDQVHDADPSSRELLNYVVRNTLALADDPVVFIVAQEPQGDLDADLWGPDDVMVTHDLGPLAVADVEELVLSVLDNTPASRSLARRLHADTDGSPAYVADMLRALVDEGIVRRAGSGWELVVADDDISHSSLPLPGKLRRMLADRTAHLPPEARTVGRALAVARHPLDLDLLGDATGLDEDAMFDGLDALTDAGVAVEQRKGDRELAELAHLRYRDVFLADLDAKDVAAQHRALGEAIEARHRYAASDVHETLAWHFERAGVATKAYRYLCNTADRLLQRGLFEDALRFLERALLVEPDARQHLTLLEADSQRAELLLGRTRALYHMGHWDEALDAAHQAVAVAETVRDDHLLARLKTRLGFIHINRPQMDDAKRVLDEAMVHAKRDGDPGLLPRLTYHLGSVAWSQGDLDLAESYWSETLTQAQTLHKRRAEGMGHNGLGIVALCRGNPREARRAWELAADIFREEGMLDYLSIAQVNLIEVYLSMALLRRAIKLADATIARARETGHPHGEALGMVWRARLMLAVGRATEAETTALEALRIAGELGSVGEQVAALTTVVDAMLMRGEGAEALVQVEIVLDLLPQVDHEQQTLQVQAMLAQVLVLRGDADRARTILEAPSTAPAFPVIQTRTALDVGRAYARLGDHDAARTRFEEALKLATDAGFRFYALLAHQGLFELPEHTRPDGHGAKAAALAKSVASSLPRDASIDFLARGWGG